MGKPYAIVKLEDYTGSAEIPLFGNDFFEYSRYCRPNTFLLIHGSFQARQYNENITDLKIKSMSPLSEVKDSLIEKVTISLKLGDIQEDSIAELSSLIKDCPGNTSLYFKIEDNDKQQLQVSLFAEGMKFFIDRRLVRYLEENSIPFKCN